MSWLELADLPLVETREEFGESATYTPLGSDVALELLAVFEHDALVVSTAPGVLVRSGRAAIGIRLADLPGVEPAAGDRVTVRDTAYAVADGGVETDGHGGARLHLRLVEP